MIPVLLSELVAACGGKYTGSGRLLHSHIPNIVIDSRNCGGGALYVPIRGDRFDGHVFIDDARAHGAAITLTDRPLERGPYILVSDTLTALQSLAEHYMRKFTIPVVGVTGSMGKTSTKEMVASVLSEKFAVHKNIGNLNNQTGLPQTIFSLDSSYDISVMEMGTNHFGEIERLSYMAKPSVCVFTNIGISHIEHLGSREGILKEKLDLLKHAKPGAAVIVNGDDDLLSTIPNATTFGLTKDSDVYPEDIVDKGLDGITFTAVCEGKRQRITVHAPGRHMVENALCAIAVGRYFGMELDSLAAGIEAYAPQHGRMDVIKTDRFTIIDDSYNSNPTSVMSAIDVLEMTRGRRVAVLGDMLELGDDSDEFHEVIGMYAARHGIDLIVCIGPNAENAFYGAHAIAPHRARYFGDRDALERMLPGLLRDGDVILVKGSRGLALEHTVAMLKEL